MSMFYVVKNLPKILGQTKGCRKKNHKYNHYDCCFFSMLRL